MLVLVSVLVLVLVRVIVIVCVLVLVLVIVLVVVAAVGGICPQASNMVPSPTMPMAQGLMERVLQLLSSSLANPRSSQDDIAIQMLPPRALPMGARLALEQGSALDLVPSAVGSPVGGLVSGSIGTLPRDLVPSAVESAVGDLGLGAARPLGLDLVPAAVGVHTELGGARGGALPGAATLKRKASVEPCTSSMLSALEERAAEGTKAKANAKGKAQVKAKAKGKGRGEDMGNTKATAKGKQGRARGRGSGSPDSVVRSAVGNLMGALSASGGCNKLWDKLEVEAFGWL